MVSVGFGCGLGTSRRATSHATISTTANRPTAMYGVKSTVLLRRYRLRLAIAAA